MGDTSGLWEVNILLRRSHAVVESRILFELKDFFGIDSNHWTDYNYTLESFPFTTFGPDTIASRDVIITLIKGLVWSQTNKFIYLDIYIKRVKSPHSPYRRTLTRRDYTVFENNRYCLLPECELKVLDRSMRKWLPITYKGRN